ncbi:hypothetical protein BHE74_00008627, partial [Ensete ventricosum]
MCIINSVQFSFSEVANTTEVGELTGSAHGTLIQPRASLINLKRLKPLHEYLFMESRSPSSSLIEPSHWFP